MILYLSISSLQNSWQAEVFGNWKINYMELVSSTTIMNKILNIRNAKKSDAVALSQLAGELGYPTTAAEMKSRFDKLFAQSYHGIFVAECDSIVGWIHISLIQSLESDSFAEIRGLVVAKSHRDSGIGTQLVAMAERWAQERGCHRIRVRTNIMREKTRIFYKKLGFQSKKTQEVFDKILQVDGLPRRSNPDKKYRDERPSIRR